MKSRLLLFAIATVWIGSTAWAQDPFGDPFGAAMEETEAEPAVDLRRTGEDEEVVEETDPAVLSIQSQDPQTPVELTAALQTLMNLGRYDLAPTYLDRLVATASTPAALVEIQREFGSGFFLRLMRDPSLQPGGELLGRGVFQAAYDYAREPNRLQALVKSLSETPANRDATQEELRRGGEAALMVLVGALTDNSRAGEYPSIRRALLLMGNQSVDPLIAALDSNDEAARQRILDLLGIFADRKAIPYYLRPYLQDPDSPVGKTAAASLKSSIGVLPTRGEAEIFLERRSKAYFQGELPGKLNHQNLIQTWVWDPQVKAPIPGLFSARDAALVQAVRISRELAALEPNNRNYQRLHLMALLDSAKSQVGMDRPIQAGPGTAHAYMAEQGLAVLEDLAHYALEQGQLPAAIGALQILGDVGDRRLLQGVSGSQRVLVSALRHPDRRVRMQATMSIRQLDPDAPFPGSSFLLETLAYFVTTTGTRRALVIHPRLDHAQSLVGMFEELGIESDTAQSGNSGLKMALARSDYELIVVSDAIDKPPVAEVISQLRRDPRTAHLPIGLMARQSRFEKMTVLTDEDPLSETFPRAHNVSSLAVQVRRLSARSAQYSVPHEQRVAQAFIALDHLAYLAENSDRLSFFDVMRHEEALIQVLFRSTLSARAAKILGFLGSPRSQQALVTFASQNGRSLENRVAAANAFAIAVQRRGLRLTQEQLRLQYERYNQSRFLDQETQQLLSAILDVIEAPTQQTDQPEGTASPQDGS